MLIRLSHFFPRRNSTSEAALLALTDADGRTDGRMALPALSLSLFRFCHTLIKPRIFASSISRALSLFIRPKGGSINWFDYIELFFSLLPYLFLFRRCTSGPNWRRRPRRSSRRPGRRQEGTTTLRRRGRTGSRPRLH